MVSVIIPTYNCASYIREAIDSVLNQTYTNYEIIIIDDGSTDKTQGIIKNEYHMVRYFHTGQNGVASARNLGIEMAKGDLIAFLDADDKWLPEKLEKQVHLFYVQPDIGMVFTENYFFRDNNIDNKKCNKRQKLMHGDVVRNIFLNSYVVTSTVMVRKRVFDHVGLFEESLAVAEDDNMWMRIAMKYRIELIDDPLSLYRITGASLSSTHGKIMEGVKQNIALIKRKYPELHRRLGNSAINIKYSDLYFSEGYQGFTNKKYNDARNCFAKAIRYNPRNLKSYVYYTSCFLPQMLIDKLQHTNTMTNGK